MTVHTGRQFLAIPGPSNMPEEVLRAMHRPAVDIYSGGLPELTESCLTDLKTMFATKGNTFVYAANGHGAWEAALANTMARGDRVLILESGRFAPGWGELAGKMGIAIETLNGRPRRAVDADAVTVRLREDMTRDAADRFKAVLVVQIDTASGVANDIAAIRKAIDASGHDALYFVDCIASLGIMPFEMDAWGVDLAVTGSQKGLMTPPGLSFMAAGEKAMAAHERVSADPDGLVTYYWDWTFRLGPEHYQRYCGTPPEHLMFGLRQALDMILDEGFESIFHRHALLAGATRAAVRVWGKGGALSLNIAEPDECANAVTTVLMDAQYVDPLRAYCDDHCNVVLGIGIGDFSGKAIRIAHMGYINAPMMLGTLGVIEMGLRALAIPHGAGGVQAAIDFLADAVPAGEVKVSGSEAEKDCCAPTCCS